MDTKRIQEIRQSILFGKLALKESTLSTENRAGGLEIIARGMTELAEELLQMLEKGGQTDDAE